MYTELKEIGMKEGRRWEKEMLKKGFVVREDITFQSVEKVLEYLKLRGASEVVMVKRPGLFTAGIWFYTLEAQPKKQRSKIEGIGIEEGEKWKQIMESKGYIVGEISSDNGIYGVISAMEIDLIGVVKVRGSSDDDNEDEIWYYAFDPNAQD